MRKKSRVILVNKLNWSVPVGLRCLVRVCSVCSSHILIFLVGGRVGAKRMCGVCRGSSRTISSTPDFFVLEGVCVEGLGRERRSGFLKDFRVLNNCKGVIKI